jgi:manganese-dependent inorganic pyrophosphatase
LTPSRVTEIIDHHTIHFVKNFPNASKIQIEPVGSCATLVAERLQGAGYTPSRNATRLLYGAIVSNTVNFRSANTTERDRALAAWLHPLAELPESFVRDMFVAKSNLTGDEFRKALMGDYILKEFGGKRIGIFQLEIVDVDHLVDERWNEIKRVIREVNEKECFDYIRDL